MTRKRFRWKTRSREILLGERTLVMGVLNVTPDSFSDGGRYADPERAFARALEMEVDGADVIDIGAESTRPSSKRISEQEELARLVPVLKRLRDRLSVPISVDTYKASVAAKALELGADIINDPSALTFDPQLIKTVVQYDAGLVLNHMRGTPDTWKKLGPLPDVIGAISGDLQAVLRRTQLAGLDSERVVLDPGLGFGKRGEQNYEILTRLGVLARLGRPLLVGPSRKSFLGQKTDEGQLMATAAAVTAAILEGSHIVRVHDVKEMIPVVKTADGIVEARWRRPEPDAERERRQPRPPRREPPSSRRNSPSSRREPPPRSE